MVLLEQSKQLKVYYDNILDGPLGKSDTHKWVRPTCPLGQIITGNEQDEERYLPLTGGTMLGDINMRLNYITDLPTETKAQVLAGPTHALSYNTAKNVFIADPAEKDLDLKDTFKVRRMAICQDPGDAANKFYVDGFLNKGGGEMSGTINMGGHYVNNMAQLNRSRMRIYPDAALSYNSGRTVFVEKSDNIPGTILTDDVDANKHTITDLKVFTRQEVTTTDKTAALNYESIKPFLGGSQGAYLPESGGTMTGDIDMGKHAVTNLKTPTFDQVIGNPSNALTYAGAKKVFVEQSDDKIYGNTLEQSLNCNGQSLTDLAVVDRGHIKTSQKRYALCWDSVKDFIPDASKLLHLSGGDMTGNLDMNTHYIMNLPKMSKTYVQGGGRHNALSYESLKDLIPASPAIQNTHEIAATSFSLPSRLIFDITQHFTGKVRFTSEQLSTDYPQTFGYLGLYTKNIASSDDPGMHFRPCSAIMGCYMSLQEGSYNLHNDKTKTPAYTQLDKKFRLSPTWYNPDEKDLKRKGLKGSVVNPRLDAPITFEDCYEFRFAKYIKINHVLVTLPKGFEKAEQEYYDRSYSTVYQWTELSKGLWGLATIKNFNGWPRVEYNFDMDPSTLGDISNPLNGQRDYQNRVSPRPRPAKCFCTIRVHDITNDRTEIFRNPTNLLDFDVNTFRSITLEKFYVMTPDFPKTKGLELGSISNQHEFSVGLEFLDNLNRPQWFQWVPLNGTVKDRFPLMWHYGATGSNGKAGLVSFRSDNETDTVKNFLSGKDTSPYDNPTANPGVGPSMHHQYGFGIDNYCRRYVCSVGNHAYVSQGYKYQPRPFGMEGEVGRYEDQNQKTGCLEDPAATLSDKSCFFNPDMFPSSMILNYSFV